MYTDIKQEDRSAETFSIFRPNQEDAGEIVEYAKKVLGGESKLVNWANAPMRGVFIGSQRLISCRGAYMRHATALSVI
jgi:hypothetical protein